MTADMRSMRASSAGSRSRQFDLTTTIEWYRSNPDWWRKLKTGEFTKYYAKQYGSRL